MRILNVMQGTNLGGMEQAALRQMVGLQRRGHSCEVISLNPVGALGPMLESEGIRVTGLPYAGKGGWRTVPKLRRALRSARADALLMTGHNLLAMLALGDLCAGRRVLAIHYHHEGVKPPWQWRWIYRTACARFQAITFPSEFVRREAEALHPPVARLAHTVRNPLPIPPVPSAADRARARTELGIPEDVPVVGNAGWLIQRKRFDVFLRVAAEISARLPRAVFVIAGDGEEGMRLRALAAELRIGEKVRWLGWQRNMSTFFQGLDVMLFNSDWDAMGLAPLEAMSHGVPVVASVIHGGLKEVLCGVSMGHLIDKHDVSILAERVLHLLRNPAEARAVGLAGCERVRDVSAVDHLAAAVEGLLTNGVPAAIAKLERSDASSH